MVERRTMGDALALNPEKLAFIHGEKAGVEAGRGAEKIQAGDRSLDKAEPARQEPGPSRTRIRRPSRRPKVAPPEPLPPAGGPGCRSRAAAGQPKSDSR